MGEISSSPTASVVVIGNEVLSGKVEEENARYLVRELRALGVGVLRICIVRDEVNEIAAEVRAVSTRSTYVFTSGGVGPTHDDVTFEGIGLAFGLPLVRNAEIERAMRNYKPNLKDKVLRMADLPEGAELMGREELSFPIIKVRNVFILPGVPAFLRSKFEFLKLAIGGAPFHLRELFLNVGEELIAEELFKLTEEFPDVEVGSYPRFDLESYKVKVTIESRNANSVKDAFEAMLQLFPEQWVVRQG